MESFLFHPVQLDKKMNICYHSETQSPLGDIAYHRGVAQLVARVLWEHDVAGSNPVIPTKKEKIALAVVFSFLLGVSIRFCFA